MRTAIPVIGFALLVAQPGAAQPPKDFDVAAATRFAKLALSCVHQEYPNKIAHVLNSDQDVKPPRELTPAFYGCYDWHSSVHGHWMLARLLRLFPTLAAKAQIVEALDANLQRETITTEAAYFTRPGTQAFERTYGWAWTLKLAEELHRSTSPEARKWLENL